MPSKCCFGAVVVLTGLLTQGCAENAFLEAAIDLPAQSGNRRFAVIESRRGRGDFLWPRSDRIARQLGFGRGVFVVEIEADGSDVGDPFRLRVRFCTTDNCSGDDDGVGLAPQANFLFERAHYVGERTSWRGRIEAIDSLDNGEVLTVDKCNVEGCLSGDPGTWCRVDGTHFCQ